VGETILADSDGLLHLARNGSDLAIMLDSGVSVTALEYDGSVGAYGAKYFVYSFGVSRLDLINLSFDLDAVIEACL